MYVNGCNFGCASWLFVSFSVFVLTRFAESFCFNTYVYIFCLVPANVSCFASGFAVLLVCRLCLGLAPIAFLIVFCFHAIQMLAYLCIILVKIAEKITGIRGNTNIRDEQGHEPLLEEELEKESILEVLQQTPTQYSLKDICSICLSDFSDHNKKLTKIASCGHIFHTECISGWLPRSNKCPNCKADMRIPKTP
ncbi:unnamed protein product [Moneuplotes crassus]|uniref:RING-type domain-containing protein n=1 Tax=Euplotes crassus TaxID=5936 RepID=A0AAD1XY04_EUPCR|nr:unnamed protein product [Moneuplotes crassus]